jgi:aspartyl-tRNA(Asn)/glutamyl-tRNA(Gln) amidotransferase subunit A
MQLIGQPFREDVLLQTTHAYQQVTDWHTRAPML